MSKIEDLQESVRSAVSSVDDIENSLAIAQEKLESLTTELEEAFDTTESTPKPEPAQVGDIVEITIATDNANAHVGQRATVIEVSPSKPYSVRVLLPQEFAGYRTIKYGQPTWCLRKGTYRVVARLVMSDYDGPTYDLRVK